MNTGKHKTKLMEQSATTEFALKAFLTLSLDLFCVREQDGCFKQLSPAWEKLLGWTESELLSKPWISFVHPDDVTVSLNAVRQSTNKDLVEYENRYCHKDGSCRWLSWRVAQLQDGLIYGVAKDITAVKQTEKALCVSEAAYQLEAESKLKESERRFHAVFNQTFQLSSLLKLDGTVLEDNQTAMDFCQIERSQILGHPFWEIPCWTISPETQQRLKRAIAAAAAGNVVRYEVDILAPDDTVVPIDFSLKPIKDESGQVELLIAEGRDLTERKRIEQELQRTIVELTEWRNRYEAVGQISGQLLYEWNCETAELIWGENVEAVLGYSKAELQGGVAQWDELVHPRDLEKTLQAIASIKVTKEPFQLEYRMRKKDGTYITVADKGQFYPDRNGKLNRVVGFLGDITKHKQTEEALRQSEERWQLALRGNNDSIWDLNFKTNQCFHSARWAEILGYDEHEISTDWDDWEARVHPDDLERVMQVRQAHLEGKKPHYIAEYRIRCKDDSYKWILSRAQALWDEAGNLVRMVGSHTDISDRKQAESARQQTLSDLETRVEQRTTELTQANEQLQVQIAQHQYTEAALRQSEEQFRRIFNDSPIGMSLEELDYRFIRVNRALCEMLGYTESELMAFKCWQLIHPEDWERELPYEEQLSKGEIDSYQLEQRLFKKNQEIVWVNLTVTLFRNEAGEAQYILGMAEDITERKQAEAEIRKALEKERELSELRSSFVSLVSHEFRTPLTTIQSSAELLDRYNDRLSDDQKQNHLTRIITTVSRMTQLIGDVLTIGKAEAGKLNFEPSPIDLVAFCRDMVDNVKINARPKHTINFVVQGDGINAQMDEKLIEHIVSNLLSNAIKYSPEGGTVQFNLICNSSSAIFRIQDTGIGIPPEYLEQMFETFQRARNVGSIPGTGLGLAIVKKCVDLHQGQIKVESEVGMGTTFIVTLPLNCSLSTAV